MRLGIALDLTLRRQNALFLAAGLEPAFPETPLSDSEMQDFLTPLKRMLEAHNPYPGCLIDVTGTIHYCNASHELLMPGAKEMDPLDAADLFYRDIGPKRIENWAEVGPCLAHRWIDRADLSHNPKAGEIAARLREHVNIPSEMKPSSSSSALCIRFRARQQIISVYSAITLLTDVRDVALEEMRLELLFPANETSRKYFEDLHQS